jgi:putative membrane protein
MGEQLTRSCWNLSRLDRFSPADAKEDDPMRTTTAIVACFFLASPALAQSVSVGEKTGVNSMLGITPATADFVKEAASSDMFEIQSSQLAEQKSQDQQTKTFAAQMITDHTKTTSELKPLAQAAKVEIPSGMLAAHQKMLDKLNGLNGDDFTKQYHDDQVSAHKDAVSLFQRYGKGGDNDQIKNWASKTVPALEHHLQMAQDLDKKK